MMRGASKLPQEQVRQDNPTVLEMRVAAFHRDRLSELRAEIRVGPELAEKGFAQRLGIFRRSPGSGCLHFRRRSLWSQSPDSATGFSVAKPKATKNEGSYTSTSTGLPCGSTGVSSGRVKWSVSSFPS